MKDKRGLSGVIITLILIAISLAVVGIVWFVISGVIESSSSQINQSSSQVFQTCAGAGYFEMGSADECLGVVKYAGGEKCCDGDVNILTGLVSWWSFDVNASDDYGNYDGTVSGATWNATGGFNGEGAYEFDGVDDYVNVASFNIGVTMTLSAWIKSPDYGGTVPLSLDGDNISAGPNLYFGTDKINWNIGDGAANYFSVGYPDSGWHYFVILNNFQANNTKLYLDGVYNGTALYRDSTATNAKFRIGAAYWSGYNVNGTIDEVRVYNRALSADEVLKLYELD